MVIAETGHRFFCWLGSQKNVGFWLPQAFLGGGGCSLGEHFYAITLNQISDHPPTLSPPLRFIFSPLRCILRPFYPFFNAIFLLFFFLPTTGGPLRKMFGFFFYLLMQFSSLFHLPTAENPLRKFLEFISH